jgi:hypothetical protein
LNVDDQALPVHWPKTFSSRLHVQRNISIDAGHRAMNTRPQAPTEMLWLEARRAPKISRAKRSNPIRKAIHMLNRPSGRSRLVLPRLTL